MSPLASTESSASSVSVGELLVYFSGRKTVHFTALASSRFSHSANCRAPSSRALVGAAFAALLPKLTRTCHIVCLVPHCCCSTTVHDPPLAKTTGFSR